MIMPYSCSIRRPDWNRLRRGAAGILMIAMLAPMVVLLGFIVNLSYINAIRAEHKVAVDSSAKAAVEALLRTKSESEARSAATDIAFEHRVGVAPLWLPDSSIHFGRSIETGWGQFEFHLGKRPFNAVRVSSDIGIFGKPGPPPIPLIFAGSGHDHYAANAQSAAVSIINEVVFCLDRSGSMKFDMSGVKWQYPPKNPHPPSEKEPYTGRPHPTDSRWAVLGTAIEAFFDEAAETGVPPRMGLVTWSSDVNRMGTATIDYAMPRENEKWDKNRDKIRKELEKIGRNTGEDGVFGGTWMAEGMDRGIDGLTSQNSHPYANRIMILLTDGEYQGPDPYTTVSRANQENITIHCVSLLAGSTFAKAQQISQATGGNAYMATDSQQLREAFRDIARSLDVVLTE